MIKPIYLLFIDVNVQNQLGTKTYGLYLALFNLCYLTQTLNDFGINTFNTRQLASDRENFYSSLEGKLSTKILLCALFILCVPFFGCLLGYTLHELHLVILLALNFSLISLTLFFRSVLSGMGYYKIDGLVSVLDKLILIPLLGYFLFISLNPINLESFILYQSISLGLCLIISILFCFLLRILPDLSFSFSKMKYIIKSSFPFAIVVLLMSLYSRMDGLMLERILNDNGYQAGVYAASFRLFDAVNIFGFLLSGLLLPMYSNLLARSKPVKPLMYSSLSFVIAAVIPVALVFGFYNEEIIDFLYTESTPEFYPVLMWLGMSFVLLSSAYVFGTILVAKNELGQLNYLFAFGVFLNFVSNLILIPIYGAQGAAISTFVTQVFVFMGQFKLCNNTLKIRWSFLEFKSIFIFTSLCVLVFYALNLIMAFSWFLQIFLGVILSIVFAFFIGLIRIEELLGLYSQNSNED